MQAIPSATSLSRTARCTSSVMSVTVSPPAVRRCVSCWNTFIVAAILRESLPDPATELPHPQWILRKPPELALLLEPRQDAERNQRPVGSVRRLGADPKLLNEGCETLGQRIGFLGRQLEEPVTDERPGA